MDINKPAIQCLLACSETYKKIRSEQKEELKAIVLKYLPELQKLGAIDLVKSYASGDILSSIKILNAIVVNPSVKRLVVKFIKDLTILYKKNGKLLQTLVKCYKSKCTPEAREFTKEVLQLFINMFNLLTDPVVEAEMKKASATIKQNVQDAVKVLM